MQRSEDNTNEIEEAKDNNRKQDLETELRWMRSQKLVSISKPIDLTRRMKGLSRSQTTTRCPEKAQGQERAIEICGPNESTALVA